MASKMRWTLVIAAALALNGTRAAGGEDALKKELAQLNQMTGGTSWRAALKALTDDHKHAKALIGAALPAVKNKELSYNAALVLGLAAAEMKDMKSAEAFMRVSMDKAVKLQSSDKLRESFGTLGSLYYLYNRYADCARVCKELLELNTDDGKARQVIATTFDKRFNEVSFAEPRDRFDTAQDLRPEVFELYIRATTKQGRFDQAIKLVDNLLKKSDNWYDRELKGWVLHESGKSQEALDVYKGIIEDLIAAEGLAKTGRDNFIVRLRYSSADIYIELKKIDLASEQLEAVRKLRPDDPRCYNDLGYIWADNNMKLDEAEKLIRKAIDLDREIRKKSKSYDPKTDHDLGAYLDSLGWVLFKQGKTKEAKEWLLKAIEDKNAQHIEIFDHLGDVHMALGERDLAIKAWEKGVEVAGESRREQQRKAAVLKKLEKAKTSK